MINTTESTHGKTHEAANRSLIMIVEDHDDTRSLYRFVLEARNFVVVDATSGEQAIRLAKEQRPNLILMDTNLPGVDGLMAARVIRQLEGGDDMAIIFLSGDAQPELQARARKAGGDEYLVKPVNLDELKAVIEKQLTRKNAHAQKSVGFSNDRTLSKGG